MPIESIKQSIAFPEIGQVRKGAPKDAKGHVGRDLKTKFRVVFHEGIQNELSQKRFVDLHGSLIVETLTVIFPFTNPMQCWDNWYEAYTAGRLAARSDGVRFLRWVDTDTHQLKVNNGVPEIPYEHGMIVGTWTNRNNGKVEQVRCKATGRLSVLVPELGRFATLTVMTTSIYDIARITEQLRALAMMAQFLPGRNGVAGIPLILSRRMTNVTWVQADGSAQRMKTGLINIEADPEWVEKMLRSMSEMALPAGFASALLPAGEEVALDIQTQDLAQAEAQVSGDDEDDLPEGEDSPPEEEIHGEIIDHEPSAPVDLDAKPAEVGTPTAATTADVYFKEATGKRFNLAKEGAEAISSLAGVTDDYAPAMALLPYFAECKASGLNYKEAKGILELNGMDPEKALFAMRDGQASRPYAPENLKDRLVGWSAGHKRRRLSGSQRGLVAMLLEKCFADNDARNKRKAVLLYIFGVNSLSDLEDEIVLAMLDDWLKPSKDSGEDYDPDPMARREVLACYEQALKAEGQLSLGVEQETG